MELRTIEGKSFWLVPGKTPVVGDGKLFTYTVYIERGLTSKYGVKTSYVAKMIDNTLADQRSWVRGGKVAFQRVEKGANTICLLASPDTVDILCKPLNTEGKVSCCVDNKVVLNVVRWKEAVPHWKTGLRTYRQMVINHEFGHRVGNGHHSCPGSGKKAPVMLQQTYGLQGCVENSWPLDSEL